MSTAASDKTANLVWFDGEFTGLHPYAPPPDHPAGTPWMPDVTLEVACIVTDPHLVPLDEGIELVVHASDKVLAGMNPWCIEHHGASGLTQRCRESTVSLADADAALLAYVEARTGATGTALLAGNSVHVDKQFIAKDLPQLHKHLHYRVLDVSTVKELVGRWYPSVQRPKKEDSAHRALADIKASIAELKLYREQVFRPVGP